MKFIVTFQDRIATKVVEADDKNQACAKAQKAENKTKRKFRVIACEELKEKKREE